MQNIYRAALKKKIEYVNKCGQGLLIVTFSTALHVVLVELKFSTPCCVCYINKLMYNTKQRNLDDV